MARITASLQSGTRVDITNERHHWYADEPIEKSGTDAGPTPYELLLGSLASCMVITVHLYARHKNIPITSVEAVYEFNRVHADDCAECEDSDEGLIERVQAHITIGGEFNDAQRQRLEDIVRRCPVHRTLTGGMKIFDRVTFKESTSIQQQRT